MRSHLRAQVLRLHELRTDAQHKGKYPTPEDLQESRIYARDFIDQIATRVWEVRLSGVSLLEVIDDERCRSILAEAHAAFDSGDYLAASRHAHYALWRAESAVGYRHVGRSVHNLRIFNRVEAVPDELLNAVEKMQGSLTRLALGIRPSDLKRVRAATGPLTPIAGGGPYWRSDKPDPGRDEAEWVLEYCTSAVWEIERRAGPITPPPN